MVHHPFVNRVTHSRTRDVAKTNGKIGGAPAMKQICTYHQNRETGVPCKEAHVPITYALPFSFSLLGTC